MNYQPVIALNELHDRQPTKTKIADTEILLVHDGEKVRAY